MSTGSVEAMLGVLCGARRGDMVRCFGACGTGTRRQIQRREMRAIGALHMSVGSAFWAGVCVQVCRFGAGGVEA